MHLQCTVSNKRVYMSLVPPMLSVSICFQVLPYVQLVAGDCNADNEHDVTM